MVVKYYGKRRQAEGMTRGTERIPIPCSGRATWMRFWGYRANLIVYNSYLGRRIEKTIVLGRLDAFHSRGCGVGWVP
jgi:hypothetical protein